MSQTKVNSVSALVGAMQLLIAPTAFAQTISETRDEISYRIKEGDSLIALSGRYFVKPDSYLAVQRLNNISNPNRLAAGSTIKIPTNLLKSTALKASIVAFKGTVQVRQNGSNKAPTIGMAIVEGAAIETGGDGFLTLALNNGSRMSLPSRAKIRIARYRKYNISGGNDIEFDIEKGRTETNVVPLPDARSRFRIRTPIAVSAVRGTVFRIGYEGPNDPSLTEVVEGSVAVNPNTGGGASKIPTGFGAAVAKSGDLNQEKLLPPPPFILPNQAQRGAILAFRLEPNARAVGYHIQIAKDEKFVDLVAAARSRTADISFSTVPDGNYFVRAMAIAPSGLEGLSETFEFKRQLNPLSSKPQGGQRGATIFSWAGLAPANTLYRIQIFPAGRSDTPIIDEVGLTATSLQVVGLKSGTYSWRVATINFNGQSAETRWTPFEAMIVVP